MSDEDSSWSSSSSISVQPDAAELRMAEIMFARAQGHEIETSVDESLKQRFRLQAETLDGDTGISDSTDSDDGLVDENGFRIPKRRKAPRPSTRIPAEDSHWYQLFLSPRQVAAIREEETKGKPKDATISYTFRMMFRVPFTVFEHLVDVATRDGWYDNERVDNSGRKVKDVRLLILGCLHMIGHAATLRTVQTNTGISKDVQNRFFVRWFAKMASLKDNYIYLPRNEAELKRVSNDYQRYGFPGCVGSIDVVKIDWGRCPTELRNVYKSKDKHPCVGYQVITTYRRFIQGVSPGFAGSLNDATTIKYEQTVKELLSGEHWLGRCSWHTDTYSGGMRSFVGCYLITDGGYLRWPCLLSGLEEAGNKALRRYTKAIAATRKDVECTFGSLKKRFTWLNCCNNQSRQQEIDHVFVTACILHNLNLQHDGTLDRADFAVEGGEMDRLRESIGIRHTFELAPMSMDSFQSLERRDDALEWDRRIRAIAEHMQANRNRALRSNVTYG